MSAHANLTMGRRKKGTQRPLMAQYTNTDSVRFPRVRIKQVFHASQLQTEVLLTYRKVQQKTHHPPIVYIIDTENM